MAVIRLDKVGGQQHLVSFVAPVEMTNGLFVQVKGLVDGERELREAVIPTDVEGDNIVLHTTPEVDADPRKAGFKHFVVAQGENARGHRLVEGNIVTLTADLFDSIPKIGDIVVPQNGSMKLDVYDALTATEHPKLRFEVIEETTLGFDVQQAFAVELVRA